MSWFLLMSSVSASAVSAATDTSACAIVMDFALPANAGSGTQEFMNNLPNPSDGVGRFGAGGFDNRGGVESVIRISDADTSFGADDFTIEFHIKADSEPSTASIMGRYGSSGNRCWYITYNGSSNQFQFVFSLNGTATSLAYFDLDTHGAAAGAAAFFNGDWHHLAVVRNGADLVVYIDGAAGTGGIGLMGTDSIYAGGTGRTFFGGVGASSSNPSSFFGAVYDEVRITAGVARYTAAFTPPSEPFGRSVGTDPHFASVKYLYSFDGVVGFKKGGTAEEDIVLVDYVGDVGVDAAGLHPRALFRNPYIPYISECNFLSGDFTVEVFGTSSESAWSSTRQLLGCFHTSTGNRSWRIAYSSSGFVFQYSTDGSSTETVSFVAGGDAGTFYNLAVVREGDSLRLYKDGVLETTASVAGVTFYDTSINSIPLGVLCGITAGLTTTDTCVSTQALRGFRITAGVARYSGASYTVPSHPLPIPE